MKTFTKTIAVATAAAALLALGVTSASGTGRGFGASGTGANYGGSYGMTQGGGYGMTQGRGYGMTQGRGYGLGAGKGTGVCVGTTAASGTLTDAEQQALIALTGEEKLAHDVYTTLATRYPALVQFSRIANAEAQHQSALASLIAKYALKDPNAGMAVGSFASSDRQAQYSALLVKAVDAASALGVGVAIEQLDIADLASLLKTVKAPDAVQVLRQLDRASDMHLVAFSR